MKRFSLISFTFAAAAFFAACGAPADNKPAANNANTSNANAANTAAKPVAAAPTKDALMAIEKAGCRIRAFTDSSVLPPGTAAPVDEHGASWPRTLLEVVHDNDTTDALFSHDHHYLDASQLGRWAARSGLPSSSLADPSDDVEGRQLCAAINRALAGSDSPYRWYSLASDDARSAYVRLDRALATALGVGIFES